MAPTVPCPTPATVPTTPTRPAATSLQRRAAVRPHTGGVPVGPARFAGASVATTLVSLALLAALVRGGLEPVVANVMATTAGAILSYRLNRRWGAFLSLALLKFAMSRRLYGVAPGEPAR